MKCTGRVVVSCFSALLILSLSPASQAARMFGKDRPFAIADLPQSNLRAKLEKMSPERRARAMRWLHRMNFPSADVPFIDVDKEGGAIYVDPAPTASGTAVAATLPVVGSTIAPADAFTLHSKPGAPNVIYLDFDGHAISGTAWNSSTGTSTLNAVPYDLDAAPASFSTAESNNVINIWRRVAEDYAPFNVDVTTQSPAVFGARTARVVITRDVTSTGVSMPYRGAGGVAYIDVFGQSYFTTYQPALVYFNNLGGGREDYVAEAISHEVGHNMGLSHDGTSTVQYYGGHGAGAASWGPIMGTGYSDNVSQWSKGEYPGANNPQDDIAIVTAKLGQRADEHGNTNASASPLVTASGGVISSLNILTDPTSTTTQNKGVIGTAADVDVFYFDAAVGSATITATPHRMPVNTAGGNLDVQLQLFNQGGALIGTASPNGATGATLSVALPAAGRYFLQVSGVGDPSIPYSDYASIGHYSLSGQIPVGVANLVPPAPNPMTFEVVPSALSASSVTMRAVTAIDDAGSAVQYLFECVAGGAGCVSSGWLNGRDYAPTGLAASTLYQYRVKARDAFGNETSPSTTFSVTTRASVVSANRAPIAKTDVYGLRTKTTTMLNVLANDSDPDGDALTITKIGTTPLGKLTIVNNQIRFESTGNATARSIVYYTISDGRGGTATAALDISVFR